MNQPTLTLSSMVTGETVNRDNLNLWNGLNAALNILI